MNVPWKNFLADVDGALTTDEVIELAGLDWETVFHTMSIDLTNPETGNIETVTVDSHKCVVRQDTQDQLGVVGDRYQDISNRLAFTLFDSLAKDVDIHFTNAGEIDGGKVVVLFGKLADPITVADEDYVWPYLNMYTSHDGSKALGVLLVGHFSQSLAAGNIALFGTGDGIKVRHSGDTKVKVKEAKRILTAVVKATANFEKTAKLLADRYLPLKEVHEILEILYPDPKPKADGTERSNSRAKNIRNAIFELYETGPGADLPTREGTAWGLYCAIVNYNATERSVRGEEEDKEHNRMKAVWFGAAGQMNRKALGLLVERAQVGT